MTGLVTAHLPLVAGAPDGINKLRGLILELAVQGKLIQQDTADEPANVLLRKVFEQKVGLFLSKKLRASPTQVSNEQCGHDLLPMGWVAVQLSDVVALVTDGDHQPPPKAEVGVPFLVIGNLNAGSIQLGGSRYVPEDYFESLDWGRKPTKGDLLYTVTGSFGIPIIVDIDSRFCVQRHVAILKTVPGTSTEFLKIVLASPAARAYADQIATGIAQKTVPLTGLRKLPVSLPPLAEQHRIVAKVDELMALCDRLETDQADAEAAHAQLVQALLGSLTQATDAADFRASWQRLSEHFHTLFTTEASIDALKQTVLQLAVMGKLIAQVNTEGTATELLASIKAKLHSKANSSLVDMDMLPSLPSSWCWTPIAELANIGTGATPSRTNPEYFNPPEINWVTSGETSQAFVTATEQKVSSRALGETNLTVYPAGTLVVAMYGQGKTRGQVTELMIDACTNQACAAIQLVCDDASHRRYVKYFFEKSYDELRALAAGGAQPNLNLGKIKETMIPLPPLAEQHRIVAKVDELMALCDQLKTQLAEARQLHAQLASVLVEQAVAA